MITVDDVTKTYGDFTAVDDVTFTARPGRVTGFLGPNGAGKSTTLRVIVGLTPPDHGTAQVLGPPVPRPAQPRHRGRRAPRRVRPARRPHRPRGPHHRPRRWGCPQVASTRCWTWSASPTARPPAGCGTTPWACVNASDLPTLCSATPTCSSSTNPPTGSTRPASGGCETCCAATPTAAPPCCCPHTCCTRSRSSPTTWSSSGTAASSPPERRPTSSPAPAPRSPPANPSSSDAALTAAALLHHSLDDTGDSGQPTTLRVDADAETVGRIAWSAGVALTELRAADGAGLEEMFLALTADTQRDRQPVAQPSPEGAVA